MNEKFINLQHLYDHRLQKNKINCKASNVQTDLLILKNINETHEYCSRNYLLEPRHIVLEMLLQGFIYELSILIVPWFFTFESTTFTINKNVLVMLIITPGRPETYILFKKKKKYCRQYYCHLYAEINYQKYCLPQCI